MRAVVFAGDGEVRVDDVATPVLIEPGDAIVKVHLSAICGSDLHLLTGKTPGMRPGAVIGHEFVGEVTEAGEDAGVALGTRVLGSFLIACGRCSPCLTGHFNLCLERRALGLGELTGDLDGAQAESVRVPVAAVNLRSLGSKEAELSDEAALFGGDILATGFYAAERAGVSPGEVAAVFGAGPVGLLTALALRTRTENVIVLDTDATRVAFARDRLGLAAFDSSDTPPDSLVRDATGALADVALDAVGAVPAFKSAMRCVRDGGRVVVVGVYGSERYELSMGMAWVRGLDIRFAGMANVQAHWDEALVAVREKRIDPVALITHRLSLDDAERGYELFASRLAMKVTLKP